MSENILHHKITKTEYKEIKASLKRLEKSTQKIIDKILKEEIQTIKLEIEEELNGFLYNLGQELGVTFEFDTETDHDYYCENQCSCFPKPILRFRTNRFSGELELI